MPIFSLIRKDEFLVSPERKYMSFTKIFLYFLYLSNDDAVKFTSEMHDPCARTVAYKREENKNTLQKAPVWSRPNTLRRLS